MRKTVWKASGSIPSTPANGSQVDGKVKDLGEPCIVSRVHDTELDRPVVGFRRRHAAPWVCLCALRRVSSGRDRQILESEEGV